LFYKFVLKKSYDSQSASFHGCRKAHTLFGDITDEFPLFFCLTRPFPTTPRLMGITVGQDSCIISLGAGGCFCHPNVDIILSFPRCQWERVPKLEVSAQKETGVSVQKGGMRMERARGEASCIDWCVKGLPGAPLLRDSPGRCKAGINNYSIGALFALLAQSQRTLVTAYHPAESPRNAVRGKCACSHDIY